jgi:hypothetical protein
MDKPALLHEDGPNLRASRAASEQSMGKMYAFLEVEELRRALAELAAIELVRLAVDEALAPSRH